MDTTKVTDPFAPFKRAIAEQVAGFAGVTVDQAMEMVEDCKNPNLGDLSIPVPKVNKFKRLEGKPTDISKKWSEEFKTNETILGVTLDGYIVNFKINKTQLLRDLIKLVNSQGNSYGSSPLGNGQRVIVEFSSPNIAKPFHAGHLRSTVIGNFLKNLHKALGYDVTAINYLGDWGKQYGLLAVGFNKYGNEEELKNHPIKHLFDVYVKINEDKEKEEKEKLTTTDDMARAYFKKMEQGDVEAIGLWRKFRDLSIKEYKDIYSRLNVEFDEYSGESLFGEEMEREVKVLEAKGLLQESEGAQIIDLTDVKLDKAIVRKKDGATLYITRDIAAAHHRFDRYNFSKMFYVVASQQTYHFNQLFAILKKMGYDWYSKCTHINFGMVKGMSTRRGNVVFLSDILDGAKDKMMEVMKKNEKKFSEIENPDRVADIIGLSAVIVQDLSARRIKDYTVDEERMTSFEGDTGPYLQYTHTRLASVQRKAAEEGLEVKSDADVSLLTEVDILNVLSLVGKYPSALLQAQTELQSVPLVTYLFLLARAVSAALENMRVVGLKDRPVAEARLAAFSCAKIVLGNGLRLLGLIPLERM